MSLSAGDVKMAYVWAAITAPKLTNANQTLVRGGRESRERSESGIDGFSGLNDVFKGNERGDQENNVVCGEQSNPGARFVHQVRAQQGL